MIPTQPEIRNPFEGNNTWSPDRTNQWQCPYCQQWIGNMQYHNCQGTSLPNQPVRAFEPLEIQSGMGVMGDFLMYHDFKKLMRADTIRIVKKEFWARLGEDEHFPIDATMDVLDDVEEGIRNGNLS